MEKCVENFSRKSIPHIEIYYLHNKFMCGKLKYDIAQSLDTHYVCFLFRKIWCGMDSYDRPSVYSVVALLLLLDVIGRFQYGFICKYMFAMFYKIYRFAQVIRCLEMNSIFYLKQTLTRAVGGKLIFQLSLWKLFSIMNSIFG